MVTGMELRTADGSVFRFKTDSNLNIRVLAHRRELPLEPGKIIDQTPRGGERVDFGTVIGVTMSGEDPGP